MVVYNKKRVLPVSLIIIWLTAIIAFSQSRETGTKKEAITKTGEDLIAIDVLLEPDSTMIRKSKEVNSLLRRNVDSAKDFDASHAHITLLQSFVRKRDLDAVTAALSKVLVTERPMKLKMKTKGYGYDTWDGGAVTMIYIERTRGLMRLHQRTIQAIAPYAVSPGDAKAFTSPDIQPVSINYVETFVPESSGDNYTPYIISGVATKDSVKPIKAKSFAQFTFSAGGVAVYQLGSFGIASKKLWSWTPKS